MAGVAAGAVLCGLAAGAAALWGRVLGRGGDLGEGSGAEDPAGAEGVSRAFLPAGGVGSDAAASGSSLAEARA